MGKEMFNFRDNYRGNLRDYMDRQLHSQVLRKAGLPITVACLDVFISLRILSPAMRTFTGILEDMVTLTPPEGMKKRISHCDDPFAQNELQLILGYLAKKEMIKKQIRDGAETFSITGKGKKIMDGAKQVFGY